MTCPLADRICCAISMLHLMYCSCMAKTLYDAFKHAALMAPSSSLVFACRRREREDLGNLT